MLDQPLGFHAKAPLSAWNQRLGVDYPGVFKAALKVAVNVATLNVPGAITAAIDGVFALTIEDAQRPPEELAWLLTRRALARAMAELTVEAARRRGTPLQDKDELVAALDRALDGAEIWIDPAFFDRPAEHPIVDTVKPQFHEWLVHLGLKEAEATSVNHRLGAYFTFALRREWAEHAEYAPLEAEFRKYENRFAKADARERAWIRNADYLQRLIREPVFEVESFGLERIYVPLRAWYHESLGGSRRRGVEEEVREKERRTVVDLENYLDAWFEAGDRNDAIRVVCGGPGSGKTSVAKMWAAKLARENHRVLFVPLHRLTLRSEHPDVQTLVWEFLSDRDVLPEDPLGRAGEPQLLLALDGLDELAMQGQAGRDLARNFVEEVVARLRNWNERDDKLVQVLLGGRDIAVEATRLSGQQVLHVLPYHGSRPHDFEDPQSLLANEGYGCARWWRQLGEAIGEPYDGLPNPLAGKELADITSQPLLNYLLALRYRKGGLDAQTASNLNLVYGDLLDDIYDRRWGAGEHPTVGALGRREFHALLDELGLAAWHGAGRTVSESAVETACDRAGLREPLARLKDAARQGAISLLAAFYFRQAGHIPGGERTFEFTHKSFGEYLTARRIVRAVAEINDDRSDKTRRHRPWSEEAALIEWCRMTGPSVLVRIIHQELAGADQAVEIV
jgi:NACHT N-terminal Helical domain 3